MFGRIVTPITATSASTLGKLKRHQAKECHRSDLGFFMPQNSVPFEPEELPRGGEGISVRTGRGGKAGERAGDGGRGLQIETGVGPAKDQLMVESLRMENRGVTAEKLRHIVPCESIDRSKVAAD